MDVVETQATSEIVSALHVPIVPTLAVNGEEVAAMIVLGMLGIGLVSVVGSYIYKIVRARAYESSRREIAAYVAEGSISADDAQKLLMTNPKGGCSSNAFK
jgi:hypothetical protein